MEHNKIPVSLMILVWLLMDRLGAAGWMFGVFWTMVVIIIINAVPGSKKD